MKLALLGVVVLAFGIAKSIPGLVATGGLWIVTGPLVRAVASPRLGERRRRPA